MASESAEAGHVQKIIDNCEHIISASNITNIQEIKKIVENEVNNMTMSLMHGKISFKTTFKDPVQAPLQGNAVKRIVIDSIRTLVGYAPSGSDISDWMKTLFFGNYTKFMKTIRCKTADQLESKLNIRETALQVIIGAQTLSKAEKEGNGKGEGQHMEILRKLLDLGADINVHDVAGFTPLHYCFDCDHDVDLQYEIANLLLEHGANVNEPSRFGSTPLWSIWSIGPKYNKCVELLIKHGADPYVKDYDGKTYMDKNGFKLSMMKSLLFFDKAEILTEQREASKKYSYKKCTICKKESTKKCSGCQMEWYCSVQCQEKHWDSHVGVCNQRRSEYLPLDIHQRPPPKVNFVVSIVVTQGMHMRIYTQDLSLECCIDPLSGAGRVFFKIVKEDGFRGFKGFFNARKENNKILVHPKILPPMMW